MQVIAFKDEENRGEWHFRIEFGAHVLATGGGYLTKAHCIDAIRIIQSGVAKASIRVYPSMIRATPSDALDQPEEILAPMP